MEFSDIASTRASDSGHGAASLDEDPERQQYLIEQRIRREEAQRQPVGEDHYQRIMREVRETRERAAATMARSALLKTEIATTIEQSQQVDARFEKFKADFGSVMNQLVQGLADQVATHQVDISKMTHKPVQATAVEAAKYLKGKKHVMILTGAGLSAASGIPTFRGANGFWTQKNVYDGYSDPEEILLMSTFKKNPSVVWRWHYDFLDLMAKCKPNVGHLAILDLVNTLSKKGECMLVTQNIDNFHTDVLPPSSMRVEGSPTFAFTEQVYEIHGNVLYMRCSVPLCKLAPNFYRCPQRAARVEDIVPLCRECGSPMKPHCMFFDEQYSEQWYRSDSVKAFADTKMDALLVVGTALQTSLARLLVNKALEKQEVPVIEVNLESCIPHGYRVLVSEPSERSLPQISSEVKKARKQ